MKGMVSALRKAINNKKRVDMATVIKAAVPIAWAAAKSPADMSRTSSLYFLTSCPDAYADGHLDTDAFTLAVALAYNELGSAAARVRQRVLDAAPSVASH